MQGGIYNAALFGASQREARGKLDQMAGIKRPSGILASSPQLMQAAAPAMTPRQPMPMPQPMMQPAPVPMVQPALPQVPMQTAMAPRAPAQQPVQQAPAPRPMAQPQAPRPAAPGPAPIRMQEGGPVDVSRTPMAGMGGASPQMIKEASKEFMDYIRSAGDWMADAVVSTYGTGAAAEKAAGEKGDKIIEAIATEDQGAIVDASMDALELPNTDTAKQEVARTMFGMEDVNDIDEINRRIANVAVASSIGEGPDEFAKAVLLGLNNYKQTAAARAAAAGDSGGGFLASDQGKAAVELYLKRIENNESPVEVEAMMNEQLGNNIGTKVRIAVAGGVSSPTQQTTPAQQLTPENRLTMVKQALEQQPENREAILEKAQEDGVNIEGL